MTLRSAFVRVRASLAHDDCPEHTTNSPFPYPPTAEPEDPKHSGPCARIPGAGSHFAAAQADHGQYDQRQGRGSRDHRDREDEAQARAQSAMPRSWRPPAQGRRTQPDQGGDETQHDGDIGQHLGGPVRVRGDGLHGVDGVGQR